MSLEDSENTPKTKSSTTKKATTKVKKVVTRSDKSLKTPGKYNADTCQICEELITVEDPISCKRCNLLYHAQCCMPDEVHQLFSLILESKLNSGSIGFECEKCSQNVATHEYVASKLENFEKIIQTKIDNLESNIANKINEAYAVKTTDSVEKPFEKGGTVEDIRQKENCVTDVNLSQPNVSDNIKSQAVMQTPATESVEDKGLSPPQQVCSHYKRGKCRHGSNGKKLVNDQECKFLHPKKCRKYCKFGREGCDDTCGQMHPVLCKSSLRFRKCFDDTCTLAHLLGTERYQSRPYQPSFPNHASYINHEYSQARENNVHRSNFRKISPMRPTRTYFPTVNPNQGFAYHRDEFPPIENTKTEVNENFIEMTNTIKRCMESIMQQNPPWKPEPTASNNQQRHQRVYASGYQKNHTYDPKQHPNLANQQPQWDEAKNYVGHNQEFAL